MSDDLQKPGEKPTQPGRYEERGPRGGEVSNPRKVNMPPNDAPLPPTQKQGRTWERIGPSREK